MLFDRFFRAIISSFLFIFLGVNIAFAFNLVSFVNPTSLSLDYTNYYFGFSSFWNTFSAFFEDGSFLSHYQGFLTKFGSYIRYIYDDYVSNFRALINVNGAEIISLLLALVLFVNNTIPMLMMLLYALMYIIYLFCFAFELVLFVIAFFGGAFATPLPSTDWMNYTNPYDFEWLRYAVVL